jgi:hypothetical protein
MRALDRLPVGRMKFVVARWLAYEALEGCWALCNTEDNEKAFDSFEYGLNYYTRQVLPDEEPCEPLEALLDRLPDEIARNVAAKHQGIARRLADAVAGSYDSFLRSGSDPFHNACEAVMAASLRLYQTCAPTTLADNISFSLLVQEQGPTRGVVPGSIHTGGLTIPKASSREGGRNRVEVQVHLSGDSFRLAEVFALPYVLFHEVVAHALADFPAVNFGGLFADGWMDHVAAEVHEAVMRGEEPFDSMTLPFSHPPRSRHFGQQLHDARYSRSYLRVGREAAQRVEMALERIVGPEARGAFWSLSTALNQSPLTRDERDEIAEITATRLSASADPADRPVLLALERFLTYRAASASETPVEAAIRFGRDILTQE